MFEKEATEYAIVGWDKSQDPRDVFVPRIDETKFNDWRNGAIFGYNKANERHSSDEHVDKDKVVLGIIKYCNKTRYSLVQWNGEWWYQYGTYNAEVRLIAWYNIPELKESE